MCGQCVICRQRSLITSSAESAGYINSIRLLAGLSSILNGDCHGSWVYWCLVAKAPLTEKEVLLEQNTLAPYMMRLVAASFNTIAPERYVLFCKKSARWIMSQRAST